MSESVVNEQAVQDSELAIPAHLSHRLIAEDFTVVELGHRFSPIVLNRARRFDDDSWYIGVETWMRDGSKGSPHGLKHWETIFADQNVEFISHDLGGTTTRFNEGHNSSAQFKGNYDPTTILADEIANEVFLSNVFTDPMIAGYPVRTKALLTEVSRLMKPDGKLVVRETITPEVFKFSSLLLASEGLELDVEYTRADRDLWTELELSYGYGDRTRDRSYYQFISKSTQSL